MHKLVLHLIGFVKKSLQFLKHIILLIYHYTVHQFLRLFKLQHNEKYFTEHKYKRMIFFSNL